MNENMLSFHSIKRFASVWYLNWRLHGNQNIQTWIMKDHPEILWRHWYIDLMNEIFRNKMFFSTVNPHNKEILIAHMEPPKFELEST